MLVIAARSSPTRPRHGRDGPVAAAARRADARPRAAEPSWTLSGSAPLAFLAARARDAIPVIDHGARRSRSTTPAPIAPHRLLSRPATWPPPGKSVSWGRGSWSWFGDPRAVVVTGQYDEIFVGWIDWSGNVTIGAYDPQFGVEHDAVLGDLFHDDHSAPSIFVEPDKRLTVFWSGHNGTEMYYRSDAATRGHQRLGAVAARAPRTISGPLRVHVPEPGAAAGRGQQAVPVLARRRLERRLRDPDPDGTLEPGPRADQGPPASVRTEGRRNGRDEIALAFTNGHPRNVLTSIYYAAYRAGSLWTAGGRRIARIARRADRRRSRARSRVQRRAARRMASWVWDVAFDPRGRPGDRVRDVPDQQPITSTGTRPGPGRGWVSHFLTIAAALDQPGDDRVRVLGRDRAGSFGSLDRLSVAPGAPVGGRSSAGATADGGATLAPPDGRPSRRTTTCGRSCPRGWRSADRWGCCGCADHCDRRDAGVLIDGVRRCAEVKAVRSRALPRVTARTGATAAAHSSNRSAGSGAGS